MEAAIDNRVKDTSQGNENLTGMLDRGIDDMEEGRELPLDEAFQKITELRNIHIRNRKTRAVRHTIRKYNKINGSEPPLGS